jgi:hypothetical protein
MKKYKEKQDDIKVGDLVKTGKFKNKKAIVKGFGKDENNQPTIIPEKGKEIKLYNVRIDKLMPKKEEKMNKVKKYLFKEKNTFGMDDDLLEFLIDYLTREARRKSGSEEGHKLKALANIFSKY